MTHTDTTARLDAAISALCDPTVERIDRLAILADDRAAVRSTNTEAAQDHRDRMAILRTRHTLAAARNDAAGMSRTLAVIIDLETKHRAAIDARRTIEALTPSLLDSLHEAVQSTQGGGGASAGVHRSPIGLAAAELLAEIARTTRHRRDGMLAETLRAWTAARVRDAFAAELVESWVTTARAILEPPKTSEIIRPCPACGTRHVWITEGDERIRRAALQINVTARITTCIAPACGTVWPEERWPLLAAALEQDDVVT